MLIGRLRSLIIVLLFSLSIFNCDNKSVLQKLSSESYSIKNGKPKINKVVPPGGDGKSWATAFSDLQKAIDTAFAVSKETKSIMAVIVAQGTYKPTGWPSFI